MNSPTVALDASNLFKAMRSRWRTTPASASMTLSQGVENSFAGSGMRVRTPRQLSESVITVDDARSAFDEGFRASGFRASGCATKEEYIRKQIEDQERDFVRMRGGKVDSHSSKVLGIPQNESLTEATAGDVGTNELDSDYDPNSNEPRYLQMAKAEIMRRRDLRCRDCGYVGLPARVDSNCPDCGGLMDPPGEMAQNASRTATEIRNAIRQQVSDKKVGLKADESAHSTVPGHRHDIHMHDLISHYGFKANGDHYVVEADPQSMLYVNSSGAWIHKHHGVHHEGHGHKALGAHLSRHQNHRS